MKQKNPLIEEDLFRLGGISKKYIFFLDQRYQAF